MSDIEFYFDITDEITIKCTNSEIKKPFPFFRYKIMKRNLFDANLSASTIDDLLRIALFTASGFAAADHE